MDIEITEWDLEQYAKSCLYVGVVLAFAANILRTFRRGIEGRIEYAISDHEYHHHHEDEDDEVDDE